MKLFSWNVNSIKMRKDHAVEYLKTHAPDMAFFQELKGEEFPHTDFNSIGYTAYVVTQKAYNGVAILSRAPLNVIATTLDGDDQDMDARYIEVEQNGIHYINIYLPNGNPVDATSEKFPYKLKWMDRLIERARILRSNRIPFLIAGDFNIIPHDEDCFDPTLWRGDALFHPDSLAKFRTLLSLGLTDAFRVHNHGPQQYTFWDYQAGCWPKNHGIRIDHVLLSPPLTDRLVQSWIDQTPRGLEKPSDHTPIWVEIA